MACPNCATEGTWDGPVCQVCGWFPGKKLVKAEPIPVLPGGDAEPVADGESVGYAGEMPQEPTKRDVVPGFAPMLRAAREQKEWTVRELADAAGVSVGSVTSVEREVRAPSLRVAIALVNALGIWDQFAKAYRKPAK